MCGICGVVQIGGRPRPVVTPDVLDRMTDAMTHRGPDDRGTYAADGVALGVRRLSIVDVAGGHQPVSNETGSIWAIQNGELYNHLDVREQLVADGHELASRCDTEILPHLYERAEAEYAEHLRGKFAICVWDGSRRRAVLARDRLGVKPLYYAIVDDLVVFGSELKAVLASGLVPLGLDYEAIDAYLTLGFFPGPRTPLASVSKLLPGCRLIVDGAGARAERYWEYPKPRPDSPALRAEEYAELVLEELETSVRLRLMSDVPLGAMLSGGLDSSLVVALMARNMTEPVKTFAVGFREAGEGNELADARYVSSVFGTDHHEAELSFADANVELDTLTWALDEPVADLSALGFLALSELASRSVTVALSGQGADELLGGYRKHRAASLAGLWNKVPGSSAAARALARVGRPRRSLRAVRTLAAPDPALRLLAMSGNLPLHERHSLVRGPLAELDGRAAERAALERLDGLPDDPLAAALYLDGQLGLVDDMLHYFDRASMAHSLEVRVPFLDHRLVELCARIPSELKVRRLQTKYVLKLAARGVVPDRVIDKPKIGFFHGMVDNWFRAQAETAIADYLLDPGARYAEFLDRGAVEGLVARHAEGAESDRTYLLFSILMLEVWLATYLPRAVGAPVPDRG
jgi:asparagine synthase (glutamine-hydrolysing)